MSDGKKMIKVEEVPPEIITEILTWLPLKPAARCQLVCREWKALLISREFVEKHAKRLDSPITYGFLANKPGSVWFNYSNNNLDGLLVRWNRSLGKYVVWNPATGRILELPKPLGYSYMLILSFAPATNTYKVFSLFKDESTLLGCQLLTLGQTNMAWRKLTIPFPNMLMNATLKLAVLRIGRSVIHCPVYKEEPMIITLDVETEALTLTHLPTGVFRDLQTVSPVEWNGKIAFCNIVRQDMEVLVLEDYKKQRWCSEKEVIHLPFLKDEGFKGKRIIPFCAKEGEIWFKFNMKKVFVYTIETRKVVDLDEVQSFAFQIRLNSYKPSFVTFKGMLPALQIHTFDRHFGF